MHPATASGEGPHNGFEERQWFQWTLQKHDTGPPTLPAVDRQGTLAAAAQRLAQHSRQELPFVPQPRTLTGGEIEPCLATDGSHAILVDNGAIWVVAYRAAAIGWPGPRLPEKEPDVVACAPDEATDLVAKAYAALGLEPPVHIASAEGLAEALRAAAEHRAARTALQRLPRGGLLLWDGALELPAGAPNHARAAADLLERARASDRRLAGVAKRSRAALEGVPLVAGLHRWAKTHLPDLAWAVRMPDHAIAHVARLHPRAPFSYRVDVSAPAVLDSLVPLARDAVYLGYPYPLAVAHNHVALTAGHAADLRDRLAAAVRQQGADAFDLLGDPHEMLDRNIPG